MVFLYIFFIILTITIIYAYIKITYGFWLDLPVFHTFNIKYKLWPMGIIQHELPLQTKYTNFKNIETKIFSKTSNFKIKLLTNFLKTNFSDIHKFSKKRFLPNTNNVIPYFKSHNKKVFLSFYNENRLLVDLKKANTVSDSYLSGVITSRPIYVTIHKQNSTFDAYYVEHFSNIKIFPELIQTHYYNQCHINKHVYPSIFKLETIENKIVPLCKYLIYEFSVNTWTKPIQLDIYKLVEINEQNFYLLLDFIKLNSDKFDILLYAEPANLIELIKTKQIFIFTIILHKEINCAYFFRKTCIFYENLEILACFASICPTYFDKNTFIQGFKISFWKIAAENYFGHATIENISDNDIIIQNICVKTKPLSIRPMAYYFYNFIFSTFSSKKTFILN